MKKGKNTKEFIVTTSAELLNTRGYFGTSMSHIMEATGLQKGGIYNHFKNKDEIVFAAFDYAYTQVLNRFKNRLSTCTSNVEKLNGIIEVFESLLTQPIMKGGCPIFNVATDATDIHPELQKKAKAAVNTLLKYVEIKVEEGKIDNEFNMGIDASQYALLLVSTMEGAILVSRVNNDLTPVKKAAEIMKMYITKNLLN